MFALSNQKDKYMDTIKSISLILHIASGFVGLIVGPISMISKKGSRIHIKSGRIFYWAMLVATISGLALSIVADIFFLSLIAIFSGYHVLFGYRALKIYNGKPIIVTDYILHLSTFIIMLGFVGYGIYLFNTPQQGIGVLSLIFGSFGILTVSGNLKYLFSKNISHKKWLLKHISGMMGGYIASVSAFSVTQLHFLPDYVQWLWPTVIFTPLIIFWSAKHGKQLETKNN